MENENLITPTPQEQGETPPVEVPAVEAVPAKSSSDRPHNLPEGYIPESAKPVVHEEKEVGSGMSPKEAMKIRMKSMTKQEIGYLRRKMIFEKAWPVFRFLILFGLGFVILTPLMFMISYGFRESGDQGFVQNGAIGGNGAVFQPLGGHLHQRSGQGGHHEDRSSHHRGPHADPEYQQEPQKVVGKHLAPPAEALR